MADSSGIKMDEEAPGSPQHTDPPPSYTKAMDYAHRRAQAAIETGELSGDDMQYFRSLVTQGRQEQEQQLQEQQMVLISADEVKKAMIKEEIELQQGRLAALQELSDLMVLLHEESSKPQKKMDSISSAAEVVVKKTKKARTDLIEAYREKKALQMKKLRCLIIVILALAAGGVVLYFLLKDA